MKWGTPRGEDSFDQLKEALELAVERGAQVILMLGDIFDARIPKQEIWARALRVLTSHLARGRGEVKLRETLAKDPADISPLALRGVPMVAIHGNHERRVGGLTNPVEALEAAGILIHLHTSAVVLETPEGILAVHGMSNVPERQAKSILDTWNPKPVEGAFNVLMLHQSVGQYVYSTEERPTISPEDLPRGFDMYLCGHVHYRAESSVGGKPLLFPGSIERTQLLQVEAESRKGFYMVDVGEETRYEFIELKSPRDFFYAEMNFDGVDLPTLNEAIRRKIGEMLSGERRNLQKLPLVRLRLKGTLSRETSKSDFDERSVVDELSDRAIVSISKDELVSPGLRERIEMLRELKDARSMEEIAVSLLDSNLRELGYSYPLDVRTLYGLLVEGREDEARERVMEVVSKLVEIELKGVGR